MSLPRLIALAVVALVPAGCGSSASGKAGPALSISGMAFDPLELSVAPGAVVDVSNLDAMAHSVTSEASAGAFTPGASGGVTFDTGLFTGHASVSIPSGTPDGTVIHYYCKSHLGSMATPDGAIVVRVPPPSTSPGYGQ
jgi:plastocyanin